MNGRTNELAFDGRTADEQDEPDEGVDESDAEAAESEWHFWLVGILIVLGIVLLVAPEPMVPELLLGLGPIFLAAGVVGWVIQWVYKKRAGR